jgi:hypothetical protein
MPFSLSCWQIQVSGRLLLSRPHRQLGRAACGGPTAIHLPTCPPPTPPPAPAVPPPPLAPAPACAPSYWPRGACQQQQYRSAACEPLGSSALQRGSPPSAPRRLQRAVPRGTAEGAAVVRDGGGGAVRAAGAAQAARRRRRRRRGRRRGREQAGGARSPGGGLQLQVAVLLLGGGAGGRLALQQGQAVVVGRTEPLVGRASCGLNRTGRGWLEAYTAADVLMCSVQGLFESGRCREGGGAERAAHATLLLTWWHSWSAAAEDAAVGESERCSLAFLDEGCCSSSSSRLLLLLGSGSALALLARGTAACTSAHSAIWALASPQAQMPWDTSAALQRARRGTCPKTSRGIFCVADDGLQRAAMRLSRASSSVRMKLGRSSSYSCGRGAGGQLLQGHAGSHAARRRGPRVGPGRPAEARGRRSKHPNQNATSPHLEALRAHNATRAADVRRCWAIVRMRADELRQPGTIENGSSRPDHENTWGACDTPRTRSSAAGARRMQMTATICSSSSHRLPRPPQRAAAALRAARWDRRAFRGCGASGPPRRCSPDRM